MKDQISIDIVESSEAEDPIVMYLIVRESLGMSIGKTSAQCCHATQLLMMKFMNYKYDLINSTSLLRSEELYLEEKTSIFLDWLSSSFTKIVLKADEKEWEKLKLVQTINASIDSTGAIDIPISLNLEFDLQKSMVKVVDAGKTELPPNTETVIGLWPMRKSQRPKLIKRLQVLK